MLQEQQAVAISRAVYILLSGKGKNNLKYEGDYEAPVVAALELCRGGCLCSPGVSFGVEQGIPRLCPLCQMFQWIDEFPVFL